MLAGIIIVFILSGVLVYIVLLNTSDGVKYKKDKLEDSENKIKKEKHREDKKDDILEHIGNYITPARFSIGLLKEDKYVSSNNCDHNVLYPINGLGPDYGWKMPKNCRCTEFVQSP
jgi:hypothetical protein